MAGTVKAYSHSDPRPQLPTCFLWSWDRAPSILSRWTKVEGQYSTHNTCVGRATYATRSGKGFDSSKSAVLDDLYSLLEVAPTADARVIRLAYLKKAKELHPDANPNCRMRKEKEALFGKVSYAYELLGDPQKRKEYDSQRKKSWKEEERQSYRPEDWREGREPFGEEFWRQVEQMRKERETTWKEVCDTAESSCNEFSKASPGAFGGSSKHYLLYLPGHFFVYQV